MRDKQIEEMAKCCTYYHNGECCVDATHICDCDLMCEMFGVFANFETAGYRKASDVAREIFEEIEKCMSCFEDDDDGYLLKKCEFEFFMRELKKKYESEGEG
jgi:hypothetical protein